MDVYRSLFEDLFVGVVVVAVIKKSFSVFFRAKMICTSSTTINWVSLVFVITVEAKSEKVRQSKGAKMRK